MASTVSCNSGFSFTVLPERETGYIICVTEPGSIYLYVFDRKRAFDYLTRVPTDMSPDVR